MNIGFYLKIFVAFLSFSLFNLKNSYAQTAQCTKTLRSFGALGNGVNDDTKAVLKALNSSSGCTLDGENLRYAVYGSIIPNQGQSISLIKSEFYQKNTTQTNIRTLLFSGSKVFLKNVLVHRGNNERGGAVGESSGIFLSNANYSQLESVSVTGHGYGAGIWIADSDFVTLTNSKIYDMRWSTAVSPRYEQLAGIWAVRTKNLNIFSASIRNLLSETGDNVYRAWQTDGITLSDTINTTISNALVENVGEGIDFTGSNANRQFKVLNSVVNNADSWAFKFANTAVDGYIENSTSNNAGFGGFVVSGPTEPNLASKSSDITFYNCKAMNTGLNPLNRWNAFSTSGFFIMQGSYDIDYPKHIRIINSSAVGTSSPLTKFGFFSQLPLVAGADLDGYNNTIETSRGIRGSSYGFNFIDNESRRILGCVFSIAKKEWYFDRSAFESSPWTKERLTADFLDLKQRGIGCE